LSKVRRASKLSSTRPQDYALIFLSFYKAPEADQPAILAPKGLASRYKDSRFLQLSAEQRSSSPTFEILQSQILRLL